MIVVDTNTIAYLLIPGPDTKEAEALFLKDRAWCAPRLWRSELRNVLSNYVRHGDMPLDHAFVLMEQALEMMRGGEHEAESREVLALAATTGCTAYDCEFAALAARLGVPLVTGDKALLRAFPKRALRIRDFLRV
jgi:predicted nucleic acid-binding protein